MAVLASTGRHVNVARASDTLEQKRMSLRGLKQYLQSLSTDGDGRVRVVVVQSNADTHLGHTDGTQVSPIDRLRHLLQPEWSDIWIVLVFAFVVGLLMLATPIAVEALVNTVAFGRFLQPVVILALILLTFLGFLAAVRALQTYVVEIIQRRLFARVAADLAYRLPRTEAEAATDTTYLSWPTAFLTSSRFRKSVRSCYWTGWVGLERSHRHGSVGVLPSLAPWI